MNLKQFLKLEKSKIILCIIFLILLAFSLTSSSIYYNLPGLIKFLNPFTSIACPINPVCIIRFFILFIFWYLTSCLIVWIFDKFKNKYYQQITSLPLKTKIVVWWMIIISCIIGIRIIEYWRTTACPTGPFLFTIVLTPLTFINLIFSFFLVKRKKWAWWLAIIILITEFLILGYFSFITTGIAIHKILGIPFASQAIWRLSSLFILLIPLILLLLDRKNFFKIAS